MNLDLFESTLEETASRYRLLSPHSSGIVACSGGRDSVALLVALDRLRTRLHVSFRVICIDHGLRDVREEVAFVGRLCEERGLPFETVAVQVPRGTGSLQGAARDARLDALERVARETKAQWVALGHTATDQSETVLFRLARGSGLRGISGIRPRRGLWIRPLLEVTREDTEAYLRENRIEWMDDPSNGDEQFTRIRIRNRWLPEMERVFPGAVQRLAESALRMQELHRWVEQEIGRALKDSTRHRSRERITCDLTVWKTLPTPLKPLVLQRAVEQLAGTEVSSRHIDALMTLASQPKGSGTIDLPGAQAVREYTLLHIVRPLYRDSSGTEEGKWREWEQIPGPGCYDVGPAFLVVEHVRRKDWDGNLREAEAVFARDSFPETVGFRALRKGDRIRPFGLGGSKKISDVLIDRKIPAAERPRLGVLTSGEVVLWLVGVMRSDVSPVDERTQNLILVRCIHKT